MSIRHCDLGLLEWKPSKPGTWPTNLRDMTQIYSNYVMWPTKRELGVFCHNYAKCKCEIYRNMPKSQVFGADHWGTTSTELCFSKHQEFPCQIWWLPLCSAPSRPSEWFNVIQCDFSSFSCPFHPFFHVFPFPFIWLIFTFHVVFHGFVNRICRKVVLFRIPAARRPQLSRSGPSGPVLPVALSTWILTEPLPFLRQELEPWTQAIPKNTRGFRGGSQVPEMHRTREHHVSLGMHGKSSNYISVIWHIFHHCRTQWTIYTIVILVSWRVPFPKWISVLDFENSGPPKV